MLKKPYCKDSWEELVDWVRQRCIEQSQPELKYWSDPIKRLILRMKTLVECSSMMSQNKVIGAGDNYFLLFPEKVYNGILDQLTDCKDLMNFRAASKLTKRWVDSYPKLEEILALCPVRFRRASNVAEFLTHNKTLPFTFFVFNFEMDPFFYEEPVISTFLRRFGCKIQKIMLPCLYQMELESEFEFYESLTNLRELYLSCTLPSYAALAPELIKFPFTMALIDKFEECCKANSSRKKKPLRIPSFCPNLRVLQIHHSVKNDYPFQLMSKCINLESLKIPRFTIPEMCDEAGEDFHVKKCSYLYDLLKVNEHLKKIDLQEVFFCDEDDEDDDDEDEDDDEETAVFEEDGNKEYLLYDLIRDRNILLENVAIEVINYLDDRYGRPLVEDLAFNITSIGGFDQVLCDVNLPNLRSVKLCFYNTVTGNVIMDRLGQFPKLESISMETTKDWMESPRGGGRQKVEEFFSALLRVAATSTKAKVRVDVGMGVSCYSSILIPAHRTLFINLIMSTFENTPFDLSRLVLSPFAHLERLIVVLNPMNTKIFKKFIEVVVDNFAGTLRSLDFETNGYLHDEWLMPVSKLKKLFVLKFKLGSDACVISDKIFSHMLRTLSLECLELEGIGFSKVTPVALRWLTTREFSKTIKHFYFDNTAPGGTLDSRIGMAVAGIRTLCEINQVKNGGAFALAEFLTAFNEPELEIKELLVPTRAFAPLFKE